MRETKFSTLTLLNIAAVVEEEFPNEFDDRYFNLDRLQDVLNDDKIFSDRDRRIIYLCFERDMAFDEIVAAENVSIEIVRYTIDIMYQKLFCFSKVYRGNSAIKDIAAYKLLDEGDTYLQLFGNKTYDEVIDEFIQNDFKFKLDISRDHAVIISLVLGFRGRELNHIFLNRVKRAAREKFNVYNLDFADPEKGKNYEPKITGQVDIRSLQEYLDRAVGSKVKILEANGL